MRRAATYVAAFSLCLLSSPAFAQTAAGGRIATTTRLVAEFSDLEARLNRAIQRKDRAVLDKLLSEDFEEWTPAPPGNPTPLDQWMDRELSANLRSFELRQMAVETMGDMAVVSLVESRRAVCGGRACEATSFIVDLWRMRGDGVPRLRVRYACEIPPPPSASSAAPTGRE